MSNPNLKLLLHFNGTDASTTITDSSSGAKTCTAKGDAQIDTAQSMFGGSSLLLDGTGDYVEIADSSDWAMSGDFYIGGFVRFNSVANGSSQCFFSQYATSSNYYALTFTFTSAGVATINFTLVDGGVTKLNLNKTSVTVAANTWYHVGVERKGVANLDGTTTLLWGGVSQTSAQYTGTFPDIAATFKLGYYVSGTEKYLNGWIDEFIVLNGSNLYSGIYPHMTPQQEFTDTDTLQIASVEAEVAFERDNYIPATAQVGSVEMEAAFVRDNYVPATAQVSDIVLQVAWKTVTPPDVTDVVITGSDVEGSTLTVTYTYVGNGEAENPAWTTFQWYRNGVAIPGATNTTYVSTSTDVDQEITCGVTPVNIWGVVGTEGISNIIIVTPLRIPIEEHTVRIEILEYVETKYNTLTDPEYAVVYGHGLNTGDFIVNKTVRDAGGMSSSERGSRKVTKIDNDTLQYSFDMAAQADNDEMLLFKFTDVTQYLMRGSLSITKKSNNANSATLKFKLPIVNEALYYQPNPGQYIKIYLDDVLRFAGIIADTDIEGINDGVDIVYQDISCIGFKGIPGRRTITVNYASDSTAGDIVWLINDSTLAQEGFEPGTEDYIHYGLPLGEAWKNDCITVADVFDECASRNGFQWFVDDNLQLHFYRDPETFTDAPYPLLTAGLLKFRGLRLGHSIDNYVNKNFVIGGKDADGNQIKTVNLNLDQQNQIQLICGGSGVYGNILRDSAIANVLYRTTEASTAFFTIVMTDHGMEVGDYIYNATLDQVFWVDSIIDKDSFMVNETIYDQAEGDLIITYPSADDASLNILRKQGFMPKTVEYTIDHIFMEPQMKQTINLPRYGIPEGTYSIESVTMKERSKGLFETRVIAVLRDENNFTTQPHPVYTDYYRGF